MVSKYVTYRIKESELQTVLDAIAKFLDEIRDHEPRTIYEAYQTSDKLSFLHVMHFTDELSAESHSKSDYTAEFVKVLYPRCDIAPVFTDITPVNPVD